MSEDMYEDIITKKMCQELLSAIEPYPFNSVIARAVKFAFKNRYEGVIVVDRNFLVQFMDPPTEKFSRLQPGEGIGKDIRELAPNSDFQLAITTGTPVIGRIRDVRGVKRIASVYPLREKGEIVGAIGRMVFHSFEEVQRAHEEIEQLKHEIQNLKQRERNEYSSAYSFDNILGISRLIRETIATAKRIAALNTDVLIEGESGTGKELFAHSIHNYQHADKPFVRINCPAIPFELAESQLFGYEKGAYTGASPVGKAGIFEVAGNGIVFLDEISSLPLSIQAKLLRVLQEREIQRLGSNKIIKVNFKFITASNVNLQKLVDEGRFRHDLYYRVARATIRIPPLRERPEDIPMYLKYYLEIINKSFNTRLNGYSDEVMDVLVKYSWPGNVRQLIHILERAAINAWDATEIDIEHLPQEVLTSEEHSRDAFVDESPQVRNKERESIMLALKKTRGNKRRAAAFLHMARSTLYKKLEQYHIVSD